MPNPKPLFINFTALNCRSCAKLLNDVKQVRQQWFVITSNPKATSAKYFSSS